LNLLAQQEARVSKINLFERITAQIADAITSGAADFVMPWHRTGKALDFPTNAISGRAYRGLNVLTLWMNGQAAGFETGQWATYRQWNDNGAQVRKGERGSTIFFWQQRGHDNREQDGGEDRRRGGFIAKSFTVFNADQVDGFLPIVRPQLAEDERDARAEEFVHQVGATIQHGGDRAYYAPGSDTIQMPDFGQFKSSNGFYSTLAHELTHWTGAKHRLDRQLGNRFGSEAYAMEELVAELGAAFTCARLELKTEPRLDHAPYIASWLKALRSDPRAIFTAATKAQDAADYLERLAGVAITARESQPEN
jgi:antirestriction protein ArdC